MMATERNLFKAIEYLNCQRQTVFETGTWFALTKSNSDAMETNVVLSA